MPTSLRHLNDMEACFDTCFTTQRTASFPSHEIDGPFSWLARKIQAKQFDQVQDLPRRGFLRLPRGPRHARRHGMVYLRDMSLEEFYTKSDELRSTTE